jgi:hypothetical protein
VFIGRWHFSWEEVVPKKKKQGGRERKRSSIKILLGTNEYRE